MSLASTSVSPVDAILRANRDRKPGRVRLKFARMAEDAFAFFRGTDHLFARAWPELRPGDAGPGVLICGDLHLENFGAYRIEGGEDGFDINDFDEALVAPCGFDVVRCATSILLALHLWRLAPLPTTATMLSFLEQYRAAVNESVRTGVLGEVVVGSGYGPIDRLLGATPPGTQAELLDNQTERTRAGRRRIRRDPLKHPTLRPTTVERVSEAIEEYGEAIGEKKAFRVLDVTGRIAGIGSLGLRRYLVLIAGAGSPARSRLLDVKEARPSSVLSCGTHDQPDFGGNEARRSVEAQRHLQARPPKLLDVIKIDRHDFRMREMVPDENRSNLDRLAKKPKKLRQAVEVVGRVAGWSHVRGSRFGGPDRADALRDWATSSALEAAVAAAIRFAERTVREYAEFRDAFLAGRIHPKARE